MLSCNDLLRVYAFLPLTTQCLRELLLPPLRAPGLGVGAGVSHQRPSGYREHHETPLAAEEVAQVQPDDAHPGHRLQSPQRQHRRDGGGVTGRVVGL